MMTNSYQSITIELRKLLIYMSFSFVLRGVKASKSFLLSTVPWKFSCRSKEFLPIPENYLLLRTCLRANNFTYQHCAFQEGLLFILPLPCLSCTHPRPQHTPATSCTPVITTTGTVSLTTQGGPEPWPAGFPSAELTQLLQCNEGLCGQLCRVFLSKQKAIALQKYLGTFQGF